MTTRKLPIVTSEIYHIFNRSVGQQPIFRNIYENKLFVELIEYYHFFHTNLRFSYYNRLPKDQRDKILKDLYIKKLFNIEIYSFSLMPNHFHLLAMQKSEKGISNFVRCLQDSYAKYFNMKNKREGALFQSPFKSVRMETEEQLLHVSRYIHLNPLTSYVLRNKEDLINYQWNSFRDYVSASPRRFIKTNLISSFFNKNNSFEEFTFNQLDYQRKLKMVKHLILE
ncbi:MAG: hypothetical protein UV73_C0003G0170 [Candidatus Gottesmanbacteria bacterium GW2011_GWA2_43_14]|uniref:Transposase IS200-like domain-containing protein n=1 Tax=Candidatus Gottesmanbacteria bacterium GW2011_GWA2_43_14 TaxID=1618443 RepID=A0A0G1GHG2_9BACT|nr:MAG: hypothetical protein UV73_C0003G0170 [Candidatus Gottesmanbacteria bacterium GW2011_GWA2_43_14]